MAKKRKRRSPSLLTKGINIGILALAFSPALQAISSGGDIAGKLADLYTAGLRRGSFNKDFAMQAYGPILAAILLKKAISMVRKVARV